MVSRSAWWARDFLTRPPGRVILFASLFSLAEAGYADWDLKPNAGANISYTDNVSQSGSGGSDMVTTVSAGLGLAQRATRINSNVRLNLQDVRHHSGSSSDQMFTQLQATSTWEAMKDRLFLDIRSSISQQRISDRGDLAFDNTTDTDNRTDVTTFSLVPRFNLPLGRFATVNATVSESQLQFSSDAVDSGRTQNVAVSVQNGSRFNKLNWDMSINQTRDYEAGSTLRDYQLGLAYRVRPKLRLTFSTGYEDSTLDTAADIPEDSGIWSVGAAWTIDRRQSLSASIGNRYNTQTYSLAYARQGRYGAIGVDYTETRTTSRAIQAEEFEVFDDNGEPIFSLLLPSITTEVFLQKTLSASFSWARARTSWSASASNETREFQLAGTTDEVFSLSGRLGYRFSDRISSSVSASWQEQSFGLDGRKDEILRLTLGTSFDLGRDMGVAFNLSHNERSSSDSTLNFDANTVSLGLTARF